MLTFCSYSLTAQDPTMLAEVTITCSEGSSGSCFNFVVITDDTHCTVFGCRWSGSSQDSCSGLWVALSNFFAFCATH